MAALRCVAIINIALLLGMSIVETESSRVARKDLGVDLGGVGIGIGAGIGVGLGGGGGSGAGAGSGSGPDPGQVRLPPLHPVRVRVHPGQVRVLKQVLMPVRMLVLGRDRAKAVAVAQALDVVKAAAVVVAEAVAEVEAEEVAETSMELVEATGKVTGKVMGGVTVKIESFYLNLANLKLGEINK